MLHRHAWTRRAFSTAHNETWKDKLRKRIRNKEQQTASTYSPLGVGTGSTPANDRAPPRGLRKRDGEHGRKEDGPPKVKANSRPFKGVFKQLLKEAHGTAPVPRTAMSSYLSSSSSSSAAASSSSPPPFVFASSSYLGSAPTPDGCHPLDAQLDNLIASLESEIRSTPTPTPKGLGDLPPALHAFARDADLLPPRSDADGTPSYDGNQDRELEERRERMRVYMEEYERLKEEGKRARKLERKRRREERRASRGEAAAPEHVRTTELTPPGMAMEEDDACWSGNESSQPSGASSMTVTGTPTRHTPRDHPQARAHAPARQDETRAKTKAKTEEEDKLNRSPETLPHRLLPPSPPRPSLPTPPQALAPRRGERPGRWERELRGESVEVEVREAGEEWAAFGYGEPAPVPQRHGERARDEVRNGIATAIGKDKEGGGAPGGLAYRALHGAGGRGRHGRAGQPPPHARGASPDEDGERRLQWQRGAAQATLNALHGRFGGFLNFPDVRAVVDVGAGGGEMAGYVRWKMGRRNRGEGEGGEEGDEKGKVWEGSSEVARIRRGKRVGPPHLGRGSGEREREMTGRELMMGMEGEGTRTRRRGAEGDAVVVALDTGDVPPLPGVRRVKADILDARAGAVVDLALLASSSSSSASDPAAGRVFSVADLDSLEGKRAVGKVDVVLMDIDISKAGPGEEVENGERGRESGEGKCGRMEEVERSLRVVRATWEFARGRLRTREELGREKGGVLV
ncbi:hypothetical protein H0H87_012144 [Tephrocybe sp. NHM501043]|nr:hypothetical protein H0H87_012144 [Tephrocybe sp. NHM501043]